MIYYEQPFIKIAWNEHAQCIEVEWLSFAFGEPYRESMNKALELHRLKGCPRSLSDMRKASVIVEEDTKWISDDWMPRAKAAGVRRIGVILPASAVVQIQLDQLIRKRGGQRQTLELGINVKYFKEYEAARRWVLASEDNAAPR